MKTKLFLLLIITITVRVNSQTFINIPAGTTNTDPTYRVGSLAIGKTTAAVEKLDVNGNIVLPFGSFLGVSNSTTVYRRFLQTGWDAFNQDYLAFYTAGDNAPDQYMKMKLAMNGNLGIGHVNPQARLHVYESNSLGATLNGSRMLMSIEGRTGTNDFFHNSWLYRSGSGSDWLTTSLHDGISIDGLYSTPGSDTKTWWERQPFMDMQSWGNGNTTYMQLKQGKLQIGVRKVNTSHSDALLSVDGKIIATSIYVTQQGWADFVFDKNYKLPKLSEIESYYKANGHLPLIPSAQEVKENGIDIGEMNKLLLQKIEELTIYMVELKKEIEVLKSK